MSKEEFTSLGLGSTGQFQQIEDWSITGMASAVFRAINDVWNKGFGVNQNMDVHDEEAYGLYNGESFLKYTYNNLKNAWNTLTNPETTPSGTVRLIDWFKQQFPTLLINSPLTLAETGGLATAASGVASEIQRTGEELGNNFIKT
jgi:hypothetical protein